MFGQRRFGWGEVHAAGHSEVADEDQCCFFIAGRDAGAPRWLRPQSEQKIFSAACQTDEPGATQGRTKSMGGSRAQHSGAAHDDIEDRFIS